MKRIMKCLLVFSLLVPTYLFVSFTNNDIVIAAKTIGNYTFEVASDNTITILNYNGSDSEVIIPSEIDGKKVKKIGYAAFAECKSIEKLSIPSSVTAIDSYAFSQCSQLKEMDIPDSVVSLGRYAFAACISLESINLPDRIKGLGYGIFFDCISLKDVQLPEGLQSIGESSFGNCRSLVSIDFPSTITSVEGNAFSNCIALETLTLPEGLNFIGSGVFSGCLSLRDVSLPNSLSGIGQSAFQDCVSLESIVLPNTVTGIGYSAFSGCTNLKDINIPSSLTSLGNALFSGCSSLETLTIPSTITEIGEYTFSGCTNLKELEIPVSVTKIGTEAFSYCSSLKTLVLPKNLKVVATSLFRYCTSLESIVVPNGVTEISATAFADCASLISVTIPNSTNALGSRVFSNSPRVVVGVASDSAAYRYVVNNKIKYRLFNAVINFDKNELALKVGKSSTFTVIIAPYTIVDNNLLTWSSSDSNVASISVDGTVVAKQSGETTITARNANGQTVTAKVTVDDVQIDIESIVLNKANVTMKKGTSEGLRATINPTNTTLDKTLTWDSSNDEIVSVSSTGSLTARAPGTATISVTTSNGKEATCVVNVISEIKSVSLNQTSLVLEEGAKQSLRATINPIDTTDSKEITWVSSNRNVATVNAQGMVQTIGAGTATISAITVNNKRAECKIKVVKAEVEVPITSVALNKSSLTLTEEEEETLTATINPANTTDDKTLTWITSNADIATVVNGKVTALKPGKVTITVKTSNGKTDTCEVTVVRKEVPITSVTLNKSSLSLIEEEYETLTATINPTNTTNDKTLTWTTSNADIATVVNGKVTALKPGKVTITVKTSNGKTDTCEVTVAKKEIPIESIELNKKTLILKSGKTETLVATVSPANATYAKDVIWTTSNAAVATVENGVITAHKAGVAGITVTTNNGKKANCIVSVYEVNKDELSSTIETAKAMDSSLYTASSMSVLTASLESALVVYANDDAEQSEVDKAVVSLESAMMQLVIKATDATLETLRTLANECKGLEVNFTETEFANMKKSIENAEMVLAKQRVEITQEEVESAITSLTSNKQALIVISTQNTLKEVIASANTLLEGDISDINPAVIALLREEVVKAQALIDMNSDDLEAMAEATKTLQQLMDEAQQAVDKTALYDLVALASGFDESLYTKATWAMFIVELTSAQSMLETHGVTQAEVNEQYVKLIDSFSDLRLDVDLASLKTHVGEAQAILANASDYIASTINGLQDVVDEANVILSNETATNEDIKAINKTLIRAILNARLKGN